MMSKCIYYYTLFYLTIVYLLGDVLRITYIDELTSLCFFLCILMTGRMQNGDFKKFILVFLFFLIYSLLFSANPSKIGVLLDANQQIKPYLFFFMYYLFPVKFTAKQKEVLRKMAFFFAVVSFVIGYFLDSTFYSGLFTHPYSYVNCMFSYAILYLFFSPKRDKDIYISLFILTCGLVGFRVKYYASYALFLFLFFFIKKKLQIRIRYLIVFVLFGIGIYFTNKEKIDFYTIDGLERGVARTYLYWNVPQAFFDYFPFGSGFASYSSWFSGEYYSPLYYKYDMDMIYGLTPEKPMFTSDTFFPNMVQIGIFGVALLFLFWKQRYRQILKMYDVSKIDYKIGVLILWYLIIENLAGSVFLMSFMYVPMAILGMICRQNKDDNRYNQNYEAVKLDRLI